MSDPAVLRAQAQQLTAAIAADKAAMRRLREQLRIKAIALSQLTAMCHRLGMSLTGEEGEGVLHGQSDSYTRFPR